MPRETAFPAVIIHHVSLDSSPLKDAFIESRVLSLSDSQCKKSRVRKGRLANHLPGMTMGWLSGEVSAVTVETWMHFSSMFRCYLFSSEDLKPLVLFSGTNRLKEENANSIVMVMVCIGRTFQRPRLETVLEVLLG